jgi:hypothetical protein
MKNKIVINFKGDENLYDAIMEFSFKEFRTPQQTILYLLSKSLKTSKTNNVVVFYQAPNNLRISCIKAIRTYTGLGVVESKAIVDALPTEYILAKNISDTEYEKILYIFKSYDVENAIRKYTNAK